MDDSNNLAPRWDLSTRFREQWEGKSDNSEIAPYQSAFFVNLATLLHTFGITSEGTFFDRVLKQSSDPQAGFVVRISYLLYRIVADEATEEEQKEFWESLKTGGSPMEREWLEVGGLTLLREA